MNKKQKRILIRIIITLIVIILLNIIKIIEPWKFICFILLYLLIGYDILKKAFLGIIKGQVFGEDFLMSIATLGAFALAIYSKSSDYNEAIAVMLFYQTGELFQSYAVRKSRKNILELMDIRPDYANIEKDGKLEQVDPNSIEINDIIIVKPGEKIPIDGIVFEGEAILDTSSLTGESKPKRIKKNDEVISGCICTNGLVKIRTTKKFDQSNVSKILELVESASSRKSKSENFISKFAKYYTPVVCILAVFLAIFPPLFTLLMNNINIWEIWIYRALSFLVISCPCALVISIPLTFFATIGGSSSKGILIKGSNYIEKLSKAKYVVFDKTGTLTEGVFEVNKINALIDEDELLKYASYAESSSNHPIAKSIQKAYNKQINRDLILHIEELSGYGISANIDNKSVLVGNEKLLEGYNVSFEKSEDFGTIIYVAINSIFVGSIVISDKIKTHSKDSIEDLKNLGIYKTIMLTGDQKSTAAYVSKSLNIDEYHYELLPIDKLNIVENIIKNKSDKETLVFVGDGTNDAPVLMRADIGISMGSIGSDAAIEASDIVLMDDNPKKVVTAIKISKKCMNIVRQNIIFSLIIKFACLILSALGLTNMWAAIFADVGVMILAILNSIRALK